MSYEGQLHHPHERGYPPSPHLLLDSQSDIPPSLNLVQAHWFIRHGERAPVRQRMVGIADIPAVFQLCSLGRQFSSAVLSLAPPAPTPSTIRPSPSSGNPFLSSSRHTTSHHASTLEPTPRQMAVKRFTEDVAVPRADLESVHPVQGGASDCYWGELTDLGRQSTLRFGNLLRRVYVDQLSFLPATLDARSIDDAVVTFRSTNMPRTIESLHQIIEGLYNGEREREPGLHVPFRVRNWMDENLYPNAICKRLRHLDQLSIKRSAELYNPELARLDDQLEPVLGKPLRVDSSPRANGILDTLMVCRAHGIRVPDVFDDRQVLETLEKGVVHEWFDGYLNPEFRKLAMGRLFSDLHAHLSAKIDSPATANLKVAINSCHDTSVGGILNALGAFDYRWPPFTSHLGIELYKASQNSSNSTSSVPSSEMTAKSNHFVRVLFNGRTLSIPGCKQPGNHLEGTNGGICTWTAFENVLNEVKISEKEWIEACGSSGD
ncbi:uncharacterized protein JCM15063_005100 [Sporobolomyces koalae]|uniref:uncharacterized protein n=1 Tax=Sporobolomyces koalae TaxID=500713 RepID=UPI00316E75A6